MHLRTIEDEDLEETGPELCSCRLVGSTCHPDKPPWALVLFELGHAGLGIAPTRGGRSGNGTGSSWARGFMYFVWLSTQVVEVS